MIYLLSFFFAEGGKKTLFRSHLVHFLYVGGQIGLPIPNAWHIKEIERKLTALTNYDLFHGNVRPTPKKEKVNAEKLMKKVKKLIAKQNKTKTNTKN